MGVKITVVEEKGRFVVRGNGEYVDDYATRKQAERAAESHRRVYAFIGLAEDRVARLVERLMRRAEAKGIIAWEAREYVASAFASC